MSFISFYSSGGNCSTSSDISQQGYYIHSLQLANCASLKEHRKYWSGNTQELSCVTRHCHPIHVRMMICLVIWLSIKGIFLLSFLSGIWMLPSPPALQQCKIRNGITRSIGSGWWGQTESIVFVYGDFWCFHIVNGMRFILRYQSVSLYWTYM